MEHSSWLTDIFINEDHSVYVSDNRNHHVMKWMKGAKERMAVASGQVQRNGLRQVSHPRGMGTLHVADSENHRVMR